MVDEVEVYDTVKTENGREDIIETLSELEDYYLLFTSSSTFTNFKEILGDDANRVLYDGKVVSIGPITTDTIEKSGYKVDMEPSDYTVNGLIELLVKENIHE